MSHEFVKIADFNNALEAETMGNVLDAKGIPFVVKSDGAFFGEGGITDAVALLVPQDQVENAKAVLEGLTEELD